MKKFIITLLFLLSPITYSWSATIVVKVDRNLVQMDQTFNLIFEATEAPDDAPDFSPLAKNFEIINKSQSSNVSIINGNYKKIIKWNLLVMAKHSGVVTIPKIYFGKDSSSSINLTVMENNNKSTATADIFMEIDLQPKKVWVQSQIIVTLRFFSAYNLSNFSGFSELKTVGVDAVIEKTGKDKQFQTKRGNQQYLVIERRLAIFPQKSGILTIPPFIVEAVLAGSARSMFDPFQTSGKIKRVRSSEKKITVLPMPDKYISKNWLPANELQISEEWPEKISNYKAGEPITRTLIIMADGLTSAQLPEFEKTQQKDIKQYPDKPELQNIRKETGIIGYRQEKTAYIPTHAGNFTLPAIVINWWNTKTGKEEVARIPSKKITVFPSDTKVIKPGNPISIQAQPEKVFINEVTPKEESRLWLWLSIFLTSGWIITITLWWLQQKNIKISMQNIKNNNDISVSNALKDVKQACQSNQNKSCKDALLTWGKMTFPTAPPNSLGQLAALLNKPLRVKINELEASLYGTNNSLWQGDELYTLLKGWKTAETINNNSDESLEPFRK